MGTVARWLLIVVTAAAFGPSPTTIAQDAQDAAAAVPGPGWSWAIPIITAVIALVGIVAGLLVNARSQSQLRAWERIKWEAEQAETKRKEAAAEEERKRKEREAQERREAAERARLQEAVRTECGKCLDEVRRLTGELNDATERLLEANREIGSLIATNRDLEHQLRSKDDGR